MGSTRPTDAPAIPTPESFTLEIERLVKTHGITYFDALIEYCDRTEREYETVVPLLSPKLKTKLTQEAARRNLLKDNSILLDTLD